MARLHMLCCDLSSIVIVHTNSVCIIVFQVQLSHLKKSIKTQETQNSVHNPCQSQKRRATKSRSSTMYREKKPLVVPVIAFCTNRQDICPKMIIRQSGQEVGQEEVSQARVPDSALQLGSYPTPTHRQAGRQAVRTLLPHSWRKAISEMESRQRIGHKTKIQGALFWDLV